MSWINDVSELFQRYRGSTQAVPSQNVQQDFEHLSQAAPAGTIASGLAATFRSPNTPPFPEMIAQLFGQSPDSQKAGILNHLIQAIGPAALSGGLAQKLPAVLGRGAEITPEQARQVPAEQVQQLADHAASKDPSVVERASEFYAQHPTLVKGLGAAALAVLMSHVSQQHH